MLLVGIEVETLVQIPEPNRPNTPPLSFSLSFSFFFTFNNWVNPIFVVNQLSHGPILVLEDS